MTSTRRPLARLGTLLAGTATVLLLAAAPALAHVTVHADSAQEGGFSELTFRVPTEKDNASTVKIQVSFPAATPLASVSVKPHPGWHHTVTNTKLAKPVTTDDGPVTEAVSQITWTADSAATAIKPGEYDDFEVSAGPLPKTAALTFPAIQTYSDGTVVRWIEVAAPGAAEPDHPAPTLHLTRAATGDTTAAPAALTTQADKTNSGSGAALPLAIAALIIAVLAGAYTAITARVRRANLR